MSRFKEIDIGGVKTVSLGRRPSKAGIKAFGSRAPLAGARGFFDSLPDFLKASDLKEFIGRVLAARRRRRPFQVMMGAHVIKVGLSPVIIDLMKADVVTGLSFNSAGLIHELELAFTGKTSEDVAAGLADGSFGMAARTGRLFGEVAALAGEEGIGLGEAAGVYINRRKAPFRAYSLLAAADRYGCPATIHIAIGTDIVDQQPGFDPAAAAEASYRDFKILAEILTVADGGGVVANIGSAVLLPEVFLKALTVARNIKKQKCNLTTANFDMIMHYRPTENVVRRPTQIGGRGYSFIGHHELMIPLLAWGLKAFKKSQQ